ncbi:Sodium/calcium exchanger protein-domain-containing protein [Pisolithus microcarpus]|nr:Sodium/calcium exchanger protein-domain-containing protein [Pisolithus microcarpus]
MSTNQQPTAGSDFDGDSYFHLLPSTHVQPPPDLHHSRSHSSHSGTQGTPHFTRPQRPASSPSRQSYTYSPRNMSSSSSKDRPRSSSQGSLRATPRAVWEADMLSEEDEDANDIQEINQEIQPARRARGKALADDSPDEDHSPERDGNETARDDEDPITVKDRQSLINVEHPFGLRIWKPALYKKSRSVTRNADAALHAIPSAQAERHLLPGNIFWVVCFGWWLALACFAVSAILFMLPLGGRRYSTLLFGLGWYLGWPFGKYVEGDREDSTDEENPVVEGGDGVASPDRSLSKASTITPLPVHRDPSSVPIGNLAQPSTEETPLLPTSILLPSKSYGATPSSLSSPDGYQKVSDDWVGRAAFWVAFCLVIAPLMLFTCIACWALIITIPMAKLIWALMKYVFANPTRLRFCAPPPAVVVAPAMPPMEEPNADSQPPVEFSVKHPRLSQGQAAPSATGSDKSTVLLCVYRAVGREYFKYTVGGVNIIFVNLLALVFFDIFDGFVLLPHVEHMEKAGKPVPALLAFIASRGAIFVMSLASVIPLSYFIGMAVASISAQSSIGMGAVINATFGSVIEIMLYSIALTQGKGHLVEGSIVGSLLAGVLLMPGVSMCAGAFRHKEQKFNAKSAGVTSMMLIMAFIGTLTPTLFYQIYGNFQLICTGCPDGPRRRGTPDWKCDHCYYQHPDPATDPFYQSTVKSLMYLCAVVLLFSYLIGLWFSLRTHASQIWQKPRQLLQPLEVPNVNRPFGYLRGSPPVPYSSGVGPRHRRSNVASADGDAEACSQPPLTRSAELGTQQQQQQHPQQSQQQPSSPRPPVSPSFRRVQPAIQNITPIVESVDLALKNSQLHSVQFPENLTQDDFTRAVTVATVSALRHQQATQAQSPARVKLAGGHDGEGVSGHSGHEAPEWSRTTSAAVLLACTALYAVIAELLVDVVDVILEDYGIEEKFLGITLFALVPNTTEFMNAISFALNANIALSMEIGSAYALQVCLLQIPAMVAFSAWYAPEQMGEIGYTFTLVFPRWDAVVIILSVFLMTYTYIEAKSNYHRGSILILSYLVLVSGFYFAPRLSSDQEDMGAHWDVPLTSLITQSWAYIRS